MPTIITTPTWVTTFDLTTNPKTFLFSDLTNYSSNSIPLTGVRGNFQITSPSGVVIWNNTTYGSGSDIVANISISNGTIPLPNLSNQAPEKGVYTVTYTVRIIDGVNPTYYITGTETYNFIYASPLVCIIPQVDCISPLFTASDTTNYTVNSITPTITRDLVLQYPANSGQSSIINSTSATITTSNVWSGLNVVTVQSSLSFAYSNFSISDLVIGTKSINVDCALTCELYCCLKSLNNRMDAVSGINNILFQQLSAQFSLVMSKVTLLYEAVSCGKQEDANYYINQIKIIADCNDCTCTDGNPSRVTGLGGLTNVNVVVDSAGAPITVTPVTVSGVTTYTVAFDSALVTKINNSYNTVVVCTDGTINVLPSGIISDVQTYNIGANYVVENRIEFLCRIQYSVPGAPVCTITVSSTLNSGTNISYPASVDNTTIGLTFGKFLNNLFNVYDFMVSPANDYKVDVEAVLMGLNPSVSNTYDVPKQLICEVLNKASGSFDFRFTDINGMPLTNDAMTSTTDIVVNIKISE